MKTRMTPEQKIWGSTARWSLLSSDAIRLIAGVVLILSFSANGVISEEIAELDKDRGAVVDSVAGDSILANPRISPADSNFISYEIYVNNYASLFVHNIGDSVTRQVDSALSTYDMAWCPVPFNRQIWGVYIRHADDSGGMYLYDAVTGGGYSLILNDTTPEGVQRSVWGTPQWSPDGKCLTYTFGPDGETDIYIIPGMQGLLQFPGSARSKVKPQPLITDYGGQFGAVWSPVPGSGYLAYNELGVDSTNAHIKIFDIFLKRKYEIADKNSAPGAYGPKWNADGTRLGYFNTWGDTAKIERHLAEQPAYRDLGFSDIVYTRNNLSSATVLPLDLFPFDTAKIKILPDHDWLHGPTWLPSGRHLLATLYEGSLDRNMQTISLRSWRQYYKYSDLWLSRVTNNVYDSIKDIDIVNLNIAFVFKRDSTQYLYKGALVPRLAFYALSESARDKSRSAWWERYAGSEKEGPGFLARVSSYLWKPIVGPDLIINKRIVPVVGGLVILAVAISDSGDGGPPAGGRNWQPPQFPSQKNRAGFGVRFRM